MTSEKDFPREINPVFWIRKWGLTVEQAAELLNFSSPKAVYRWMCDPNSLEYRQPSAQTRGMAALYDYIWESQQSIES